MAKDINIAVFASGSGTNAERIIKHFNNNTEGPKVGSVFTNRADAGVVEKAIGLGVTPIVFKKGELSSPAFLSELTSRSIDFIVLSGFLLKVPEYLVDAFPNKIINIHPALLPKFGGKGMYGKHVHKAVFEQKEKESGITIHYVNEHYDEGNIIAQFSCALDQGDTPETIEQKVRALEEEHFVPTINKLLRDEF